jgi:hypothetical protein
MFAKRPELFAGGLVTGRFQISDAQAKAIAAAEVPLWVTHGINDHLLNISLGRGTNAALDSAYEARGKSPEEIARLVHSPSTTTLRTRCPPSRGIRADVRGPDDPPMAARPEEAGIGWQPMTAAG